MKTSWFQSQFFGTPTLGTLLTHHISGGPCYVYIFHLTNALILNHSISNFHFEVANFNCDTDHFDWMQPESWQLWSMAGIVGNIIEFGLCNCQRRICSIHIFCHLSIQHEVSKGKNALVQHICNIKAIISKGSMVIWNNHFNYQLDNEWNVFIYFLVCGVWNIHISLTTCRKEFS